ncbi:hypothetical protein DCAR_0105141 [Daucus carota subsp. sativus]|uniref:Uncharacterized protein n=1 Tax=Daucus carota subsp. sativus TaxID=79200 RepID=A0A166JE62_DAUCS|nr:PREDICTED: uncharacterized protein LOC108214683 [Daucus carota subsp. sativus]WOG85948.1 hypothetical protein DCAR_0105141 [Daucus carota subsp. sativus]
MEAVVLNDPYERANMRYLLKMRNIMNIFNVNAGAEAQEIANLMQQKANIGFQTLQLMFADTPGHFAVLSDLNSLLAQVKNRLAELNRRRAYREHAMGRVQANFQNHLIDASFLEVDNWGTATYAVHLRDAYGWMGSVCISDDLPVETRNMLIHLLANANLLIYVVTGEGANTLLTPAHQFPFPN